MLSPISAQAPLGDALGGIGRGGRRRWYRHGAHHTDIFGGGIRMSSPDSAIRCHFGGTRMHTTPPAPTTENIGLDVLKIPGTNGPDVRQTASDLQHQGYISAW